MTYTVTKAIPASYKLTSTYQSYVREAGGQYKWSNANSAQAYITFDFTSIPEGATITNVSWRYSYEDSKAGTGYQTIRQGENLWDYASDATIKKWLTEQSKTIQIMTSFRGNNYVYTDSGTAPTAVRKVSACSITVTYEVESTTHVRYGTSAGWQECEVNYIDDGTAHKCDAYYGVNGSWVKVGS